MAELVDRDQEWLNMLALAHYIAAGVTGLFACFPILHVVIGAFLTFMPQAWRNGSDGPPREVGLMFMGMGLAFMTAGWLFAGAHFIVARSLKARRRFIVCLVVSAVTCFACMFTSGIVSIATLVVLLRPGVKPLFEQGGAVSRP